MAPASSLNRKGTDDMREEGGRESIVAMGEFHHRATKAPSVAHMAVKPIVVRAATPATAPTPARAGPSRANRFALKVQLSEAAVPR